MADRMTKAEFLHLFQAARAKWDALMGRIDEARMTEPGVEGDWSFKEIVAPVTWYEREMVDLLRARALVGSDLWNLPQDERNAAVFEQNRDRLLPDVLAEARAVVGFLWYGPLFAKPWMKLVGMTQEDLQRGAKPVMYLGTFVGALVAAYVLALFINATQMTTLLGGAGVGLLAGPGFVAPSFGANYIFGRRPLSLCLIDAGYQIVSLMIGGIILGLWRWKGWAALRMASCPVVGG